MDYHQKEDIEDAARKLNIEMNDEKCQLVSNFQVIEEWHNYITKRFEASLYYLASNCLHSIEYLPIIPVDSKAFFDHSRNIQNEKDSIYNKEFTGIPSLVRFLWGWIVSI